MIPTTCGLSNKNLGIGEIFKEGRFGALLV